MSSVLTLRITHSFLALLRLSLLPRILLLQPLPLLLGDLLDTILPRIVDRRVHVLLLRVPGDFVFVSYAAFAVAAVGVEEGAAVEESGGGHAGVGATGHGPVW